MKQSAGLIVFRRLGKGGDIIELFLTHPGGPFNAKKDAWSITKGELEVDESHLSALKREFLEETGIEPPLDNLIDLGSFKANGKETQVWAVEGDLDISKFHCDSLVDLEWPPRSGKRISFPENDKADWLELSKALTKVYKSQTVFIERLAEHLRVSLDAPIAIEPAADKPPEPPTNITLF